MGFRVRALDKVGGIGVRFKGLGFVAARPILTLVLSSWV